MNDITDKLTTQDMDGVTGRTMDDSHPDAVPPDVQYHVDPERVDEALVELEGDHLAYRNTLLRSKKRGVLAAVVILVLATLFPLWFLQTQEQASSMYLWSVVGIVAVLIMLAMLCYVVFTRQITRDLQTNQALLLSGFVISGWQVNERRDPMIRMNIGNHLVDMPIGVMRRHMDRVTDLEHLTPGCGLIVEMTPYARVITRIIRV